MFQAKQKKKNSGGQNEDEKVEACDHMPIGVEIATPVEKIPVMKSSMPCDCSRIKLCNRHGNNSTKQNCFLFLFKLFMIRNLSS